MPELRAVKPWIRGSDLFVLHDTYGIRPDEAERVLRQLFQIVLLRDPEQITELELRAIWETLDSIFMSESSKPVGHNAFLGVMLYDRESGEKLFTIGQMMRLED